MDEVTFLELHDGNFSNALRLKPRVIHVLTSATRAALLLCTKPLLNKYSRSEAE